MSDALREVDGIDWIRKRQFVPSGTATFAFNRDTRRVSNAARADGSSNLQDWIGGRQSIELTEDAIGLGSYGKTLTVLYNIEVPEEEGEDEERSLDESWTPKFHR
jgi:hypothetical protein